MHTNIFYVGRPAAREDDGSTGGIESLGHIGIPSLINLGRRIAPVQLQHVHPPRGECVGILLDVVQSAGVTSTGVCPQVWIKKDVQKSGITQVLLLLLDSMHHGSIKTTKKWLDVTQGVDVVMLL